MYNIKRTQYHDEGRGNGYVITDGGQRFYLSGDTEGSPEMQALRNIDVAFVCMNLPYTMPPDEAADAVKAFHPKIVYPYHSQGSDVRFLKRRCKGPGSKCQFATGSSCLTNIAGPVDNGIAQDKGARRP